MKYEFDRLPDRRGTYSSKWHVKPGELPMWVADMDFEVCPEVRETLQQFLDQKVYGYSDLPDRWEKSYIDFYWKRHQLAIPQGSLLFSQGVVPTISSTIRELSKPGEQVAVLVPNYHIFYHSILNDGRVIRPIRMSLMASGYQIDWSALEEAFKDPRCPVFLFSNPANPFGSIFTAADLQRIGELSNRFGKFVISDEIHGEITEPGYSYNPYFKVSEAGKKYGVVCLSPTKAFNIAGLQTSSVLVEDEKLRARMAFALNRDELMEGNFFSYAVSIACFDKGEAWLDQMRDYVFKNRRIAEDYIDREIPELCYAKAHATYLMWIEATALPKAGEFASFLREKTGLYLSDGSVFGEDGKGFLRMNLATSKELLRDGLQRLKEGVRLAVAR